MFKEMRRKERELPADHAARLLAEGEYGILGTAGEDKYPYTTPLNYIYVDGSIYFHSAPEGHKLHNIRVNSRVSFCVVGKTKPFPEKFTTAYESVVVFGQASALTGEDKKQAFVEIVKKYAPAHLEKGMEYIDRALDKTAVIKISIERMTGKGNHPQ